MDTAEYEHTFALQPNPRVTLARNDRSGSDRKIGRRWRAYATTAGKQPVAEFLAQLSDHDAAQILAAMKDVAEFGNFVARHLDGDIWEVRADGQRVTYRVLFASVGSKGRILLALEAFPKKSQKTPPAKIALAKRRLHDWNGRGKNS